MSFQSFIQIQINTEYFSNNEIKTDQDISCFLGSLDEQKSEITS